MKKNIYILTLLLIISCTQVNRQACNEQIINCEFSEKDNLKLSDFAESIEIIPLETNNQCFIDLITKIKKHNNLIYIGDASNVTKRILVFNDKGKLLYKLDKRGMGPGEYVDIADFAIIADLKVAVITTSNPRLFIYDIKKDSCLLNNNIDIYPDNIIFKDKSLYITKNGTRYKEIEENNLIRVYDLEGNYNNSFFHVDDITLNINSNIVPAITISKNENNIYITYPFCDTIYEIDNKHEVSKKIIYNFGDKKTDISQFNKTDNILDIENKVRRSNCIYAKMYYHVGENYVFLSFYDSKYNDYISFHNIQNNKTYIARSIIDDIYFKGTKIKLSLTIAPKLIEDGYLYCTLEPSKLTKWHNQYKERTSKQEWEAFCNKHPHLVQVVNNLKEDDNPLIMKIKLKDEI